MARQLGVVLRPKAEVKSDFLELIGRLDRLAQECDERIGPYVDDGGSSNSQLLRSFDRRYQQAQQNVSDAIRGAGDHLRLIKNDATTLVERSYDEATANKILKDLNPRVVAVLASGSTSGQLRSLLRDIEKYRGLLVHQHGRVDYMSEELGEESPKSTPTQVPAPVSRAEGEDVPDRVFVVHGHDDAAKEQVARFLEKLGLEAVVLHEQPSGGRTIIEKFEHYADVSFAVVLLTPDDEGRPVGKDDYLPRARQNVVFEFGYFVGKLGRDRVCALNKGIEKPSDIDGVLYVSMNDGAWRMLLAREMKAAGLPIDLNKVI